MAQKLGVDEKLPSLDMLPDLPLLKVFSYLDLKDLCRVRRVCSRWYHLTRCPTLWRYIPASNTNTRDIRKVLPAMPESIRSLKLSGKKHQHQYEEFPIKYLLHAIEKLRPNMEELVLKHFEVAVDCIRILHLGGRKYRLVYMAPGLMWAQSYEGAAPSDLELDISFNVRVLNLTSCCRAYLAISNFFCSLENLEEIYLPHCLIDDEDTVLLLEYCKKLRVIDLENTEGQEVTFEALGRYGNTLQELYMANTFIADEDLKHILSGGTVLPSLKVLCLKGTRVTRPCLEKYLRESGKEMQVTPSDMSERHPQIINMHDDDFCLYIERMRVKYCDHHKMKKISLERTCHIEFI